MALHSVQVNIPQLNQFINNDCRIFEKGSMDMAEYFLNNKIVRIEALNPNQPNVDQIIPVGVAVNKQQQLVERSKSIIQPNTSHENYSRLNLADNVIETNKDIELNSLESVNNLPANNFLKSKLSNKPENSMMKVIEEKNPDDEKADEKEDDEDKDNIDRNNLSIEEPTAKDYSELSRHEQLIYDKRSFGAYLKEAVINEHRIISILFKKTLFHPLFIKVNKLIFELSMGLAINALMYTANYIDKRATANDKVSHLITLV
jgi:hypothetical protein